ncbi:hypothetical protein [Cupriavidus basilensis]|uniref:hypothetical protein n=1 Tax=Cupriavidus basilensis TaxID=68895 RepID=UPI00157AACB5|nr:hypothetical protein [Cupriavidus basilensis]NUA26087.1 hypothetical protein [Cupriavidus basilensis]
MRPYPPELMDAAPAPITPNSLPYLQFYQKWSATMTRDYATYVFEVKEGQPNAKGDAPTSLYCQPCDRELSIVGEGFLSINFVDGVDVAEAQQIAKLLQQKVKDFSFTR